MTEDWTEYIMRGRLCPDRVMPDDQAVTGHKPDYAPCEVLVFRYQHREDAIIIILRSELDLFFDSSCDLMSAEAFRGMKALFPKTTGVKCDGSRVRQYLAHCPPAEQERVKDYIEKKD